MLILKGVDGEIDGEMLDKDLHPRCWLITTRMTTYIFRELDLYLPLASWLGKIVDVLQGVGVYNSPAKGKFRRFLGQDVRVRFFPGRIKIIKHPPEPSA